MLSYRRETALQGAL